MYIALYVFAFFFFFQAEDGIRDLYVTGVQTCALPICPRAASGRRGGGRRRPGGDHHPPPPALRREGGRRAGRGRGGDRPRGRSEERRVGKECRAGWSADHEKKKKGK